jgi:DNA-binding response OmpR family regulator
VQPRPAESAVGVVRTPQPAGPRRKTVLVIEDNATIGGLLVALVREAGYRALRAWDGREALRVARDRKPELILLELSLPYPTGVPLLEDLKGHPETKDAPILMVTGNSVTLEPGQRELLAEWVTKPVDIDRLENAVRRALGDPEVAVPAKDYSSTVDRYQQTW